MTALFSKTISITIPLQLEEDLKKEAAKLGISRSRLIGNLLLDWQKDKRVIINDCRNQREGWCIEFGTVCQAPQSEAETCSDYLKGNNS